MSELNALVHGVAIAAVGLVDHDNARVSTLVLSNNRERGIRRAIVNADNLDVFQRLVDQAVKALTQIAFNVADWDKDGNFDFAHINPIRFTCK